MMRRLVLYSVGSILVLGTILSVHANPITGSISLSGNGTFNATATAFSDFSGVTVVSATGSFASAGISANTDVTMSAFSFSSFPALGVIPLWMISNPSASFDLTSLGPIVQVNGSLMLSGEGTFHLAGYDKTPGRWTFSSSPGTDRTFSFTSDNVVPDGGTTVLLLGVALSGLAVASRKLR